MEYRSFRMTRLTWSLILLLIVFTIYTVNYCAPTSSPLSTTVSTLSGDEPGNDLNYSLNMELSAEHKALDAVIPHVEAQKLIKLMASEGRCNVPRRKVKYISRELNNGVKKYRPHAVLLNVCDNESGCCMNESENCQPKAREKVDFYFFTTELVYGKMKTSIETLSFYNDTMCECQQMNRGIFS